ncbi:MAG: sensor domain-containing diguanylate cyclase [Candidatus Omnitrophica bacterium]|nr:sensor domain-containing diguanylate cyclase [Candidatus Omnitrophota bacterium]
MNIYAFLPYVAGVFSLEAGFYILIKTAKTYTLRLPYFFAALCVSSYCFLNFGFIQFIGYEDILVIWTKIFAPGAYLTIPALFNLMLFVGGQKKGAVKFIFLLSLVLGLSALLYQLKSFSVTFSYMTWGSSISILNFPYRLFLINMFICLPAGILLSYFQKDRVCKTELVKRQMNFILLGILVANIAMFFDVLPVFGVNAYHAGSPLIAIAFISLLYSFASYRLLDINPLLNKVLLVILFVAPLLSLHLVICMLLLESQNMVFNAAFSVTVISGVLLFTPYKSFIQALTNKIIYHGRYDYQKILQEVCQSLISMLDLEQLLDSILHLIIQTIDVDKVAIFLEDEDKFSYKIKASFDIDEQLKETLIIHNNEKIVERLKQETRILVKEELSQFETKETVKILFDKFTVIDAELIAPIFFKDHLLGLIVLSRKRTKHMYNQGDIDVLNAFVAEVSVAIENARLYGEAIVDGLTRTFQHNYFYMRLKEEVARVKRYKRPIALLMIDIDHFKNFNDTYGHQAGDLILRNIGNILKTKLRNVDIAARYGGEEFSVILTDLGSATVDKNYRQEIIKRHMHDAILVAERLRKAVEDVTIEFEDKRLNITISIGIAYYDGADDKVNAEQLVKKADRALYQAKQDGRNRIVFSAEQA